MPIGIMTNVLTVAVAGAVGGLISKFLPQKIVTFLTDIFGFCSITIGITALTKINSLTVVILSVLLGSVIGAFCDFDLHISQLISGAMEHLPVQKGNALGESQRNMMCMLAAIVCFSGTGIFGAISEGLDGNSSILMAKSVMDFASILIFAVQLGGIIALFSIPQAVVFLTLYFAASFLAPFFTAAAIADFKAVGGLLTLVIGYNLLAGVNNWKVIKVLNMIPALAVVLIISHLCSVLSISL